MRYLDVDEVNEQKQFSMLIVVPIPSKLVGGKPTLDKELFDGAANRMVQRQYYRELGSRMPYDIKV